MRPEEADAEAAATEAGAAATMVAVAVVVAVDQKVAPVIVKQMAVAPVGRIEMENNPLTKISKPIQVTLFVILMLIGLILIDTAKSNFMDSKEARSIKKQLDTISSQLDKASKLGDKVAAVSLIDQVLPILQSLNERPDILQSPLRGCQLAAAHLVDGIQSILGGSYWISRDRYENSLKECK